MRCSYALEKGVMISINPDSHSIHEIDIFVGEFRQPVKADLIDDLERPIA